MTVPTRPKKDQNLEIGRGRRRTMIVLMLGPHLRTERENCGDDGYGSFCDFMTMLSLERRVCEFGRIANQRGLSFAVGLE